MQNDDGQSRRIDLHLRAEFSYLNTVIYKIRPHGYKIFVDNAIDIEELKKYFHERIRFMAADIHLVDTKPINFISIVENIKDKDISKNFEGMVFTHDGLITHIKSKYPNLTITRIETKHEIETFVLTIEEKLERIKITTMEKELNEMQLGFNFLVKDNKPNNKNKSDTDLKAFQVLPSSDLKKYNIKYAERDESLWFDKIDDVYNKSYTKDDLYFYDSSKSTCLVNMSLLHNVNIRNLLLLYDVIYCILPVRENMKIFLEHQKLTRDDLLYLVQKKRLSFINLSPDTILDYGFLNEVYQENNNSVIGSRALSLLSAVDIVDMNKNYIFNDTELEKYLVPFISNLSGTLHMDPKILSNFISWPKFALRKGFDMLHNHGTNGLPMFGVNSLLESFMPKAKIDEYRFELLIHSPQIHLAHSLDSTYYPFYDKDGNYSEHPYSMMMSNLLNLYKYGNVNNLSELQKLNDNKLKNNPSIDLISLFDINDFIPIEDFEQETNNALVRKGMNTLFTELSSLDVNNRKIEIKNYNNEVESIRKLKRIKGESLDLGTEAISAAGDLILVRQVLKGFSFGLDKMKKHSTKISELSELIDYKIKCANKDKTKENISLLSKVNRVATLKKNYNLT